MRIILFLFLTLPVYGQHRQRLIHSDLEQLVLKGQVKSYTNSEYQSFIAKDSLKELKLENSLLAPTAFKVEFNEKGYKKKLIECEYSYKENTLTEKGLWFYKYDNRNRIVEELYCWNNRSNDTTKWVYDYPNDSTTLINRYSKHNQILRYQYVQSGEMEYYTKANSDSSTISKALFVYDEFTRLTRKEDYDDK
ncbi:MAG: hypothetical protein GW809_04055 [Bacteroidetes bacterium]|nr:hypothetical protein [Bacteroidota bacterium]